MRPKILVLTEAEDFHAIAVTEALIRRGAEVTLWATSDFPTRSEESIQFVAANEPTIRISGPDLDLSNPRFDVVWRRRPAYVLDPDFLHPADRAFAESECGIFRRSLLQILAPDAFWVNPPAGAAHAGSKILQQKAAVSVGLKTPETIFTNSPSEVRSFLRRRGQIVYKPFCPAAWRSSESDWLPYTALLTEDVLVPDEMLRLTPGIFQELVLKAHELRVTVIGRRTLTAKVLSQQTEKGRLDWRNAYDELRFEPAPLPPEVEQQCFALLDELGLVFGCFDFVVTPEGEHVFLEVNEMGQFLFVERYCGLPLLDAFTELLLQRSVAFEWNEDAVTVRYTDPEFEEAVQVRAREFRASHVTVPEALVNEEDSPEQRRLGRRSKPVRRDRLPAGG